MANNKLKLTSELSLKDMALDNSQFYIPKKVKVDFTQARPKINTKTVRQQRSLKAIF